MQKAQAPLQAQGHGIAPGSRQQAFFPLQSLAAYFGATQGQGQQGRPATATQFRNGQAQGLGCRLGEAGAAFLAMPGREGRQQERVQPEAQSPAGLLQPARKSGAGRADAFLLVHFYRADPLSQDRQRKNVVFR